MSNYNGWTNYATWRIMLEIVDDMAEAEWEGGSYDQIEDAYKLSKTIREQTIELLEMNPRLALEYAQAFVDQANFYEMAEHIMSRIEEHREKMNETNEEK